MQVYHEHDSKQRERTVSVYFIECRQPIDRLADSNEVHHTQLSRAVAVATLLLSSLMLLDACEEDSYNPDGSPTASQIKRDLQAVEAGRALGRAENAQSGGYTDPTRIKTWNGGLMPPAASLLNPDAKSPNGEMPDRPEPSPTPLASPHPCDLPNLKACRPSAQDTAGS